MANVHYYKYLLSFFQLIIKLWARETKDWITQDTTISCKHDRSAHIQVEHHDPKLKIFCITSYIFLDKVKKQVRTSIIVYLTQNLIIRASYIVKTKRQGSTFNTTDAIPSHQQ